MSPSKKHVPESSACKYGHADCFAWTCLFDRTGTIFLIESVRSNGFRLENQVVKILFVKKPGFAKFRLAKKTKLLSVTRISTWKFFYYRWVCLCWRRWAFKIKGTTIKIHIKNLRARTIIGTNNWERDQAQDVIKTLYLFTESNLLTDNVMRLMAGQCFLGLKRLFLSWACLSLCPFGGTQTSK